MNRREAITQMLAAGIAMPRLTQRPAPVTGKWLTIDGNKVYYEERGQGIPIVMSPGGQNRVETLRPLAERLAAKYHVITWDRANLGHSDIVLKGARDLDLWSDQQAELVKQLNIRPAYFVGASSGSRTAYVTALRYPDLVRGLFVYLVTGGGTMGENLAKQYYGDYADLAEKEGMQAVAKTPFWAERIELNSGNRERLLSMDPHEFARVMRRWVKAMRSNPDPTIGITADSLREIASNGTPVAIIQGCEGVANHPRDRSELFAKLANATLIPSPAGYCEEGDNGPVSFNKIMAHHEVPEAKPFRAYEMVAAVPPLIDEFITRTEAKLKK
jgi:pimeloyl-ACP methyl ester carboxylesterase